MASACVCSRACPVRRYKQGKRAEVLSVLQSMEHGPKKRSIAISEQLKAEAAVNKERRKAAEEKELLKKQKEKA